MLASKRITSPSKWWCLQAGGWCLEAGGWYLEAGGWCLEASGWYLEASGWCLQTSLPHTFYLLKGSEQREPKKVQVSALLLFSVIISSSGTFVFSLAF